MKISHFLKRVNEAKLESVDDRLISLLRLTLAVSALLVIYIDPSEPDRFVEITYTTLIAYCLYSGLLYWLTKKGYPTFSSYLIIWIDVVWYSFLISLSSGANSIFFFFYFFSILVMAFRWGFRHGFILTVVSVFLFAAIGYLNIRTGTEFELNRLLLRPIYLLLLGYMVSFWGGREIKLRKRLALLNDANAFSNPRFGVNHTFFSLMRHLRAFYDADSCLLLIKSPSSEKYLWREVTRDFETDSAAVEETGAAIPLFTLAGEYLLHFQSNRNGWLKSPECYVYDFINNRQAEPAAVNFPALADLLEAESFVSVPMLQHEEIIGRVYLTSNKNLFDDSDTEFIRQFFEQILPSIKNIELLDLLASEAAETQRQKISRDIHDSTIQPYIGLKLGLEALEIKSSAGKAVHDDIENLIKLADSGIADLRGYVRKLESGNHEQTGDVLITALHRQIEKFRQFYGIKIQLQAGNNFHLNDRLAAEIFQMVLEGLSNIRRHTAAKSAFVNISREAENMIVEIANPTDGENTNGNFVPKSIKGRAESLGGELTVRQQQNLTVVMVKIPL